MDPVTVRKDDLVKVLTENRNKHRAIFEEALEGYRAKATQVLESHLERIKNGKVERVFVQLPLPEDHTRDYDRVIAMLEMDVKDELVINENDFQSYVLDDWAWKQQFLTASASYSKMATDALANTQ